MSGISLYNIEQALLDLTAAREELLAIIANPPAVVEGQVAVPIEERKAELAEVERLLVEYAQVQEPAKVDSIHWLIKWCEIIESTAKAETKTFYERARRAKDTAARVKAIVLDVMTQAGKTRINGTAGRYLLKQGGGGLAPLIVDGWDAELEKWSAAPVVLPESLRDVTVKMPASSWRAICELEQTIGEKLAATVLQASPSNPRIRAALAEDCKRCGGTGETCPLGPSDAPMNTCDVCGGTGKRVVPGARLGERAEQLRCK